MSKYKPQHSRLLFIDKRIGEGRYPNCGSLAEEWEVSSKTIQRDLEYMRYQLDAPLEYSARHRGYFYTEKNFNLPAISIKESDLFAIYLAEELLQNYKDTPIYESLRSIFAKIQDSLPEKNSLTLSPADTRFSVFLPPNTTIRAGIWETVFLGLRQLKRLKIIYQTPGKDPATRKFDPYHAVRYSGDWYIIGFCHQRERVLTFSLSRILQATLLGESFSIPMDYDFHQVSSSRFGIHWGATEEHVKIHFSAEAAQYVLERQWHPSQKITENEDGSVDLDLTVDHTNELKRWILSWGRDAKVLEPENLSLEMKEEVERMKDLYW